MVFVNESVHGHHFDRRNAECLDVLDDLLIAEPGELAALSLVNVRVLHRVRAHVALIEDRLAPRNAGLAFLAGYADIRCDTEWHIAGAVCCI